MKVYNTINRDLDNIIYCRVTCTCGHKTVHYSFLVHPYDTRSSTAYIKNLLIIGIATYILPASHYALSCISCKCDNQYNKVYSYILKKLKFQE